MLAKHCKLSVDWTKQPWLQAHKVIQFRNNIVHSCLEEKVIEKDCELPGYEQFWYLGKVDFEIRDQVTLDFAEGSVEALTAIKKLLDKAITDDQKCRLHLEGFSSASVIVD